MKNYILSLIACLFLCGMYSCESKELHYYKEYAYYHSDQIENFESLVKLNLQDSSTYNQYFTNLPQLTSNTLPLSNTNPGSWYKGEGNSHLAEGEMVLDFCVVSNSSSHPDTIIHQVARVVFRKADVEENIFWIPIGIKEEVDINSDLMHIARISWQAKLDEKKELSIDLKLSNQINFRWGDQYSSNHQINTLYGFSSNANYLAIPIQHLSIKSSEGKIFFYTNTSDNDFEAVWESLTLSGQVVNNESLTAYEQEDYNYSDLEYFVSLDWVESEVPKINFSN